MRIVTEIDHPEADATLVIDCYFTPGRPETGPSFAHAAGDPCEPDDFDWTIYMKDDPEKQDVSAILARQTIARAKDAVREKYEAKMRRDPDAERDAREDR